MRPEEAPRIDSARIRQFFGGLLAIVGALDVLEALIVQRPVRTQVLDSFMPASVSLVGRTGAVIAGLALLLVASGVARGKRVAWQLTIVALLASMVMHVAKDLDLEEAVLAAWVVAGLWWMRAHFRVASGRADLLRGGAALLLGLLLTVVYGVIGVWLLRDQLTPTFEVPRALQNLLHALVQASGPYDALTDRAAWFLGSLPWVAYGLVLIGLFLLLRPVVAPAASSAERARLRALTSEWGHNPISHLALYGPDSQFWLDGPTACVAYSVRASTAVALGDPVASPDDLARATREFRRFCDERGWTCAFYQVEDATAFRRLGFRVLPIGSEAIVATDSFTVHGGKPRADVRHAIARCRREGIIFRFTSAPAALEELPFELAEVSGSWLRTGKGREMGFGLGTLATLHDPDITVGLAFDAHGDLVAFTSWLPVPRRHGWTLDLMRRRPGAVAGVMDALIAASIEEARSRGLSEVSLGLAPLELAALSPLPWFRRARTLRHFKQKFATSWERRYLAVPATAALPEVLLALLRVHLPPMSQLALRLGAFGRQPGVEGRRRWIGTG